MVISKTQRELNKRLDSLDLPRTITTSRGTRKLTIAEKRKFISKTIKFNKAFKKEGKLIGKKTVLFRGRKFTRSGILI